MSIKGCKAQPLLAGLRTSDGVSITQGQKRLRTYLRTHGAFIVPTNQRLVARYDISFSHADVLELPLADLTVSQVQELQDPRLG